MRTPVAWRMAERIAGAVAPRADAAQHRTGIAAHDALALGGSELGGTPRSGALLGCGGNRPTLGAIPDPIPDPILVPILARRIPACVAARPLVSAHRLHHQVRRQVRRQVR